MRANPSGIAWMTSARTNLGILLGLLLSQLTVVFLAAGASADENDIKRGEYLVRAGLCITCHTDYKNNGEPFAGGRPLTTPFGTIYSTNITPKGVVGGRTVRRDVPGDRDRTRDPSQLSKKTIRLPERLIHEGQPIGHRVDDISTYKFRDFTRPIAVPTDSGLSCRRCVGGRE